MKTFNFELKIVMAEGSNNHKRKATNCPKSCEYGCGRRFDKLGNNEHNYNTGADVGFILSGDI